MSDPYQYENTPYQYNPEARGPSVPGEYPNAYQNAYQPAGFPVEPTSPSPAVYGGYPYPEVGQPGYYRPTDGYSIASLVLGLLGFNIFAIVFGMIGLGRTANNARSGRGMAVAGIILGSLWLIFWLFILFLVLVAVATI